MTLDAEERRLCRELRDRIHALLTSNREDLPAELVDLLCSARYQAVASRTLRQGLRDTQGFRTPAAHALLLIGRLDALRALVELGPDIDRARPPGVDLMRSWAHALSTSQNGPFKAGLLGIMLSNPRRCQAQWLDYALQLQPDDRELDGHLAAGGEAAAMLAAAVMRRRMAIAGSSAATAPAAASLSSAGSIDRSRAATRVAARAL